MSDSAVLAEIDHVRAEAEQARLRRQQVSLIKRAGVPAPRREVGRLVEALARAGFFDTGMILIGTVAFGCYPALLGHKFENALLQMQDADFAVASIADVRGDADILEVLRRADPTFRASPTLDNRDLPRRFKSGSGLDVELLAPVGNRTEGQAIAIPGTGASAVAIHDMEYLLEDAVPALMLHGAGIRVKVPSPMRYGIHKLIIAQDPGRNPMKKAKDLDQARQLFGWFSDNEPDAFADALIEAAARGPKWRGNMAKSLLHLGEDPAILDGA
jgi:hypothetical protein